MSMRQARIDIYPGLDTVVLGQDIGVQQAFISERIHTVNLEECRRQLLSSQPLSPLFGRPSVLMTPITYIGMPLRVV